MKKERHILNELDSSRNEDIKKAIDNVFRVRIGYDDEQGGGGKRQRFILPVAFGKSKSGNDVIRAYQTAGSSKRGLSPNKWKLFRKDRIYSWDTGNRSFKDYEQILKNSGLNTDGDNSMTDIYAITPFANQGVVSKDVNVPISHTPVTKNDVSPSAPTAQKEEPAIKKVEKNLDKNTSQSYFKNKVEAPPTQPINKQDVSNNNNNEAEPMPDTEENSVMPKTDSPVTKDDVLQNAEVQKMHDVMNRMDNLDKDEEEGEE